MRKRLFEIIEVAGPHDTASHVYDLAMIAAIIMSLVPFGFKERTAFFDTSENVCTAIFIADYLARCVTADHKLRRGGWSFLLYPFTPMAIVDLLSILPTFSVLATGFRMLRMLRLFGAFRVIKMFRYSENIERLLLVIRKQREPLTAVCILATAYLLICALVMFNVEPDTFDNFFEAFYWATISLTTTGYGDIYPVTALGRAITMLSSFVGVAIVALPSGIVTAGYMAELRIEETQAADGDIRLTKIAHCAPPKDEETEKTDI